jgi:hypothetical protein
MDSPGGFNFNLGFCWIANMESAAFSRRIAFLVGFIPMLKSSMHFQPEFHALHPQKDGHCILQVFLYLQVIENFVFFHRNIWHWKEFILHYISNFITNKTQFLQQINVYCSMYAILLGNIPIIFITFICGPRATRNGIVGFPRTRNSIQQA